MKKHVVKSIGFSSTVKRIFSLFMVGAVMINLSGCYFFPREEKELKPPLVEPPEIIYETIDVKKGIIEKKITGTGTFASVLQDDLYFKYKGGNLRSINVKLGDKVKAGDVLAELDTDSLKNQIDQQSIVLKRTTQEYENLKEYQVNQYDLEKAKINVDAERVKLEDLQQQINNSKVFSPVDGWYLKVNVKLGDSVNPNKSVMSVWTVDGQVEISFKNRGGIVKAIYYKYNDSIKKGDLLAELDTSSLEQQVKQQQIVLNKAILDYENLKASQVKQAESRQADLNRLSMNVELDKLKLADLEQQYDKSKLVSSIAGQVVYIDKLSAGDYVSAYRTVVRVADPARLQIIYKGENATEFQVGMTVLVKYKDKEYQGKVTMTPSNMPIDMSQTYKNTVFIGVDGLPQGIEIGESASISLILEKKENVIVLPRNVVNTFYGRSYVQVLDKDMKYERDVQLGVQTPTEVEIVKGLNEGDKVIMR